MAISESGFNAEIVNTYVQGVLSVSTTQVEAKVGTNRLGGRQMLRIYNASNSIIYFGPSGVTSSSGEPLEKKQWINIPAGDALAFFLVTASGTAVVIVSEWA
jgi:hypothetical protein